MKNYLEIYVGSRGVIEGIEEYGFENIEEYLGEESGEWDKVGDGYVLSVDGENEVIYVDMECKNFKEFVMKELDGVNFSSWNDLVENKIWDLINSCNLYL